MKIREILTNLRNTIDPTERLVDDIIELTGGEPSAIVFTLRLGNTFEGSSEQRLASAAKWIADRGINTEADLHAQLPNLEKQLALRPQKYFPKGREIK